jgi:hypothetical protein
MLFEEDVFPDPIDLFYGEASRAVKAIRPAQRASDHLRVRVCANVVIRGARPSLLPLEFEDAPRPSGVATVKMHFAGIERSVYARNIPCADAPSTAACDLRNHVLRAMHALCRAYPRRRRSPVSSVAVTARRSRSPRHRFTRSAGSSTTG